LLPVAQVHEELAEHAMSHSMHDMPKEGCGDEMEVYLVLSECLWIVYAGAIFDTWEGFKSVSGTDREIEKELAPRHRNIGVGMALPVVDGCSFAFAHRRMSKP
jgi:hypothetical protein